MTLDEFIPLIITGKSEEPISLFISYAHREALICRLIVKALLARGHKVWFDELNIPHDSDWRREILKGIEDSSNVLSLLSRDAVNPGGVCLDELTIAVGVRGGNIRTVLLEKGVTPPPTITFRQWLDLTEWQDFKKDDFREESLLSDPVFTAWFREKINLLIGALETRENREFEGQITVIRNSLPSLYMAASKQMFLLKEFHIERAWLREKAESWLDDPEGESTCVIYGEPGIGKSAFAAHYAHYNGRVAAAIFCEKGQNTLNSPEAILQTLAYMLACRIADYREYLADLLGQKSTAVFLKELESVDQKAVGTLQDELESADQKAAGTLQDELESVDQKAAGTLQDELESADQKAAGTLQDELESVDQKVAGTPQGETAVFSEQTADLMRTIKSGQKNIGSLNADELFEVLFATPFLHLIKGERPVECIIVDGLDEAGNAQKNDLASVFEKYGPRLPKWLRILVLSRNVPGVQNWFNSARQIDLSAEIKENRDDLETFVRESLKELDADPDMLKRAEEAIVSRSDGVFLYAKTALTALLEGKISLEEADTFPRGLNQIFLRWFQWYFPDPGQYDRNIRPAINLILASPEPIPEEEIIEITGWRQKQLGDLKSLLQVHLRESVNEVGKTTLDFNHMFIREWLESPAAGKYRIYSDDGVLEMADFFAGILSDDEPEINEYEALYIPQIMERAADLKRSMRGPYRNALRSEALMKRQEKLGKRCWEWNLFSLSSRYLQYALQIAECRTNEEDIAENRKHIVICKNRLAKVEQSLGHADKEKILNEEALVLARQNLTERGLPEDMRRAAVSIMMIADHQIEKEESLLSYREAGELLEKAASMDDDEKIFRNLAIVHNRMGAIALGRGDYKAAAACYMKDLKISQRLAMETGKPQSRQDFAVSCFKLAGVYRLCGWKKQGIEYYKLARRTMEFLVKGRGQPDDYRGLIVLLNAAGKYIQTEETEKLREPLESYQRALTLGRETAAKYGMPRDHLLVAASLANIGIELFAAGDRPGAKEYWIQAQTIYEKYGAKEVEEMKQLIDRCEV